MGTHRYKITINAAPQKPITYTYKYDKTEGIELKISKQKVAVSFQMTTKKEHDDIISFRVRLVKDALRKAHLLHAISFDSSLTVKKIIVVIDDEERIYTSTTTGFPFFFSMLDSKNFGWGQSWSQNQIEAVLSGTKTQTENDYRFISLFSYLAGQSKQFEIDRFTCLWTAMNAHYNHIAKCYEDRLCQELCLSSRKEIKKKQRLLENDAGSISALLEILEIGNIKPRRAEKETNIKDYGALKDYLHELDEPEVISLHEDLYNHRTDMDYVPEGRLGEHLKTCIEHAKMSAYAYILLEYAYYLRCKYVHGNKATILFAAYHDAELAALRVVNYFLAEHLKQSIPAMFDENYFTDEMYQCCKNNNCRKN